MNSPALEQLDLGLKAHSRGDLEAAKLYYERVLDLEPESGIANGWLGTIEACRKNFPRARLLLEKALAVTNDLDLLLNYANVLYETKDFTRALAAYLELVTKRRDPALLSNMAACCNELNQPGAGLRYADEALAIERHHPQAWNNRGVALSMLKRHEESITSYERSIALKGDYAEAWNNHGVVLLELKRYEEARYRFERAIELNPLYAEALYNHGNALVELRCHEEALISYGRVIVLNPEFAEVWNNRGIAYHKMGQLEEALHNHKMAITLKPNYAEAFYNLGNSLNDLGRYEEALVNYERATELKPAYAGAWNNRGNALMSCKRYKEALKSYERSIELNPNDAQAWCNRGLALFALQRHDDALSSYQHSIALKPDCAEAFYNLGILLNSIKRSEEALASYRRAIKLKPNYADAWNNQGVVLRDLGQHEAAIASYEKAVEIKGDYAEAWYNRGVSLSELRRHEEAMASYDRAINLNPECAEAYWNKSLELLRLGNFNQGWPLYEWRWLNMHLASAKRDFPQPLWLGDQPIYGKTILLHAEQGYGDTIQFCRYACLVKNLGSTVILEVEPTLVALLKTLDSVDVVIERGATLPAFDYHCPLLSLPLVFKTELPTIPCDTPYLSVSTQKSARWVRSLSLGGRSASVGIAWSGNPSHQNDKNRSISLDAIYKLFSNRLEWICLQKDLFAEDRPLLEAAGVRDFANQLHDFSDTAALISQLDLIISVDTSIAHLSGALGKPVWVLLPYVPDFRWMWDREDSPWYPSMRLFRQPKAGDWGEVVSRVSRELDRQFSTQ